LGKVSTKAKDRWNNAHYTQVKISVAPDTAAAFKAACVAGNTSMARELSSYMKNYCANSAAAVIRLAKKPLETRGGRRNMLKAIIRQLEELKEAEEHYCDNIPCNLRNSARFDASQQSLLELEAALDILADVF